MNRLWQRLIILPIISLAPWWPVLGQDQAERLFANANTFMNAGKYKEALTDLESLIASYGNTPWAPKALLKMGNYYLEAEADFDRALSYFIRIQTEYPQSEEAPAAYYSKAAIVERQGESVADLETAVADLIRMRNLFPGNASQSAALFLFGKLSMRLEDYTESLKHFHNLEFTFPKSEFLPRTLLLSARATYLEGDGLRASMILARLQSRFPNSREAEIAASFLRLLDRFINNTPGFSLDQTFFGSTPKRYSSPTRIIVTPSGVVAVKDQKGVHTASLNDASQRGSRSEKDVTDFCVDRDGNLLVVHRNRVLLWDGQAVFTSLSHSGNNLKDIRSAAMDDFGRLYVVDGNVRNPLIYARDGTFLKSLTVSKPKLVRCYGGEAWVLGGDGIAIHRYDSSLNASEGGISGISSAIDFRFDPFGNLYVLSDKGNTLSVYSRQGNKHYSFNLKSGTFPLKQAGSVGVDMSGAIYLADRRAGAVYRFH